MGILISILTFLAVFLGIFTVNLVFMDLFKKDQDDRLRQLENELRAQMRQKAKEESTTNYSQLDRMARDRKSSRFSMVESWKNIANMIEQSGVRVSVGQLAFISVLCAMGAFALAFWLTSNWIASGMVAAVAVFVPFMILKQIFRRRIERLTSQLPDALDLISRILRAGQTIHQGMLVVSEEFSSPIREEFGYCYEQQNLGVPTELALRQLAERTGIVEIQIFVMGVLIQQSTGGNLAQLLDKLAKITRDRFRMKSNIAALTAEGRLQAKILMALPFALWLALYVLSRSYALKLLEQPLLIMVTILCMAIGAFWIRKIVVFDF